MSAWIVQFRRPMVHEIDPEAGTIRIISPESSQGYYDKFRTKWAPQPPRERVARRKALGASPYRIRYWNGHDWTVKYKKAYPYKTRDAAERAAFRLALKDTSLFGELLVEEWVPLSKPSAIFRTRQG